MRRHEWEIRQPGPCSPRQTGSHLSHLAPEATSPWSRTPSFLELGSFEGSCADVASEDPEEGNGTPVVAQKDAGFRRRRVSLDIQLLHARDLYDDQDAEEQVNGTVYTEGMPWHSDANLDTAANCTAATGSSRTSGKFPSNLWLSPNDSSAASPRLHPASLLPRGSSRDTGRSVSEEHSAITGSTPLFRYDRKIGKDTSLSPLGVPPASTDTVSTAHHQRTRSASPLGMPVVHHPFPTTGTPSSGRKEQSQRSEAGMAEECGGRRTPPLLPPSQPPSHKQQPSPQLPPSYQPPSD